MLWFVHMRWPKNRAVWQLVLHEQNAAGVEYHSPRSPPLIRLFWQFSRLNKTWQRRKKVITLGLLFVEECRETETQHRLLDEKPAKISGQLNGSRRNIFGRCTLSLKSIVELNQNYKSFLRFVSQETVFLLILFITKNRFFWIISFTSVVSPNNFVSQQRN